MANVTAQVVVEEAMKEESQLMTTFYVGLASYTVLIWDHLLTFDDEVKYIWQKKKRSPLIWLFILNRYLTPLAFVGNLYAYFSNTFDHEKCAHFVRFEGAATVIGVNVAALMMLLRIYAMYEKRKPVVAFVAVIFCCEFGTNAWLLTNGIAVNHSEGVKELQVCTMIFDPTKVKGVAAAASAWTPLVYDTIVLVLTTYRTYSGIRNPTVGRTMRILLQEGVMYYSVIFVVTLVLTLMIAFAPPGLQNICAQMEYLLTVAMMSRITLHLKRSADKQESFGSSFDLASINISSIRRRPGSPIEFADYHGPSSGPNWPCAPFNVTVQEQRVVHDDRGEEIQVPRRSLVAPVPHVIRPTRRPKPQEEWYEFTPLRPGEDRDRKIRLDEDG